MNYEVYKYVKVKFMAALTWRMGEKYGIILLLGFYIMYEMTQINLNIVFNHINSLNNLETAFRIAK